jgi:hypothetical protein
MFQQQSDGVLVRSSIMDIVALRSGKGTRKVGFVSIRFLEQGFGQTSASMRGAGSVPGSSCVAIKNHSDFKPDSDYNAVTAWRKLRGTLIVFASLDDPR